MLLPCQERLVRVCRRLKQIRCLCHRVPGLQTSYFPYQTEYFRKKRKNLKCNNCLFHVCTKNFFQVHNKNMFESCLDRLSPWLSQSADRKPRGGYQAAKLAGPDITFQFQPEILIKTHVTQSWRKHIYMNVHFVINYKYLPTDCKFNRWLLWWHLVHTHAPEVTHHLENLSKLWA